MTVAKAILRADEMRENVIPEELKAEWLHAFDCEVADIIGADPPKFLWPEEQELLFSEKQLENVYVLYLMTQIDLYHGDDSEYANDSTLFNAAFASAKAWWRRNHRPQRSGNWRI